MNAEEFDKLIKIIPKSENKRPVSTMSAINIEDLRNTVDKFKKIPTYQELLKENKKLKNQLERAKSKLTTMFANGHDDKVLDDLLELGKILEVE